MDKVVSVRTSSRADRLRNLQAIANIDDPNTIHEQALIILLDCSGSMFGDKINTAWRAFVDELAPRVGSWSVGILRFPGEGIGFSNVAPYDWIMSPNKTTQISTLHRPDPSGGTPMYAVVEKGLDWIKSRAKKARMILITDGHSTDKSPGEIIELARPVGIPIDCVGIGSDCDEIFLQQLSEATNGIFTMVYDVAQISKVLQALSPIERPMLAAPKGK